jgi:hypothetical protein
MTYELPRLWHAHLWSARPLAYGALMTYQTRLECTDHWQGTMRRALGYED